MSAIRLQKWRARVQKMPEKVCFMCGAHYRGAGLTCNYGCHVEFNEFLRGAHKSKVVVDAVTGKKYEVPTKYIIEHSLTCESLKKFPEVN